VEVYILHLIASVPGDIISRSYLVLLYATQANRAVKLKKRRLPSSAKRLPTLTSIKTITDNRYRGYDLWLPITPTEYFTVVYSLFTHCHIIRSYANNNAKNRGKIWGHVGIPYVALLYTFTDRERN
jgi:hypothetical protein